ncbi:FadR/GntR family transcriptional regulator [Halomonas garicola]|uniref:FadR/GntR family transcriptional regulator n=1 Tax=Halomonas garicola TaxID=1690008 RepID=UPI00289C2442|nr:FadR/GntR family transcriptional regulator [Halomonas garicola]
MAHSRRHRPSLVDEVIANLKTALEQGRWAVGERLPVEASLAEDFAVSRNTVREAVRVLCHTGVLETRQGAGTFVRALRGAGDTLREVERARLRDQLEVRQTLESDAARLAALRRSDADVAAMREALNAREAAGEDIDARIEHDQRFHLAVVQAAHNEALATLYEYFACSVAHTIEQTERNRHLPEPGHAEHVALLKAIEAGHTDDAEHIARAMLAPSLGALTEAS